MSLEGVFFPNRILDELEELSDVEVGRLFRCSMLYAKGSDVKGMLKGNERFLWATQKIRIDEQKTQAEEYKKSRSNNAKKGWEKRKSDAYADYAQTKNAYDAYESICTNVNVNASVNASVNDIDVSPLNPPKGRFTPPTVEEVRTYCEERNNTVDADRFVDFYSAKGWMVGKNKMKDWKAAVRTWEKDSSKSAWEKELEDWVNGEK